jgi:hypothetical protein
MTPKEKAEELVEKFADYSINLFDEGLNLTPIIAAKKCALVAVDEIIDTLYEYHYDSASGAYEYWTEVKEQLEKL